MWLLLTRPIIIPRKFLKLIFFVLDCTAAVPIAVKYIASSETNRTTQVLQRKDFKCRGDERVENWACF